MSSVVGICSASRTGLYLKQQKKMSRIQKFNTPVVMPLIGHLISISSKLTSNKPLSN